jgi:hypothetical protein
MALPPSTETPRLRYLQNIVDAADGGWAGWPTPKETDYAQIGKIIVLFTYIDVSIRRIVEAAGNANCWGYQLFLHGSGLSKGIDKLDFKSDWGKVSFAGMSVGGALMVTSVFWGGFAYLSVPKLELAGDVTKITQGPSSKTTLR